MDKRKQPKHILPNNFIETVKQTDKSILSINFLVQTYKVAPSVINRWLNESGLSIEKTNDLIEKKIDLVDFKNKVESGKYTKNEIKNIFKISSRNISDICRRNNINENLKSKYFEPDNKDKLIKMLNEEGKQKAANFYNTTLMTITCWCKKNNIKLPKYHGLKRNDLSDKELEIKSLYNLGYSIKFIANMFETSGQKIKSILQKIGINVVSQHDKWDIERSFVETNISLYIEENKNGLNLKEISAKHNISYGQLQNQFKNKGVEVILHSYNKSKGEIEVKNFLQSLGFEVKSVKRKFNEITYEIDCFIEEKKFAIEYCGEFWHSENNGMKKNYHYNKFDWCKKQDISLMTIFENEWYKKRELIESMIKVRLGIVENKVYAKKTTISVIPNTLAKIFHDENHISGGLKTYLISIGLYYDDKLVAVGSFSKSRFAKEVEYELIRFSSLKNTIVVGGFSKIFKYFLYIQNPISIVSYCDLRFGEGKTYLNCGFEKVSTTPPNYWYYYKKDGSYGSFESRIKYQKHKLKIYNNYSEDKTEYQIMSENGFLKIYDCGNNKFVYRNK